MDLWSSFLQRLEAAARPAFESLADGPAQLEALRRDGQTTWPTLSIGDAAWLRLLGGAPAAELAELRGPDLHLAAAALAGLRPALITLDAMLVEEARSVSHVLRLGGAARDDALQSTRERLLVGAEPKLAKYSGRGPLGAWLAVTLARVAVSAARKRTDTPLGDDEDDLAGRLVAHADAELDAMRGLYADVFRESLEEAILALPPEERNLLRFHFVDGLSIDALAPMLGVHRATAARRLSHVRALLFEGTRARMIERLGVSPAEFASVAGLVLSRLDVSVRRLLLTAP